MKRYLAYLKYVLRHKWYVAKFCFRYRLFWRGIMHDMSKFRPSEFIPYAKYFYTKEGKISHNATPEEQENFDTAWLLHQKRNDHHWQYWICPQDDGGYKAIQPKDPCTIIEMVCDWQGASMAQSGKDNVEKWYEKNEEKIILHEEAKDFLELILLFITDRDFPGERAKREAKEAIL